MQHNAAFVPQVAGYRSARIRGTQGKVLLLLLVVLVLVRLPQYAGKI